MSEAPKVPKDAIAAAVFLAKQGESKKAITAFLEKEFAYDLNRSQ